MTIRKALLVGINAYPLKPLRGCINDVRQLRDLLIQYYDFSTEYMRILLDNEATQKGIQDGLEWLAQGGDDPDAVRVFHFSGHGSYLEDKNGDEPDGQDECLVPVDYTTAGMITDDVLKQHYDRFPRTGNLTLIMDSCFSGTVQRDVAEDVAYRFIPVSRKEQVKIDATKARFNQDQWDFVTGEVKKINKEAYLSDDDLKKKVKELMGVFEKKRFGDIRVREANVLLAGCRSDQQSADAQIDGDYHGAFTYCLAEAIVQSSGQVTYQQLIKAADDKLDANGFVQIPQLECAARQKRVLVFRPFKKP